eukprot:COSAG02_NODE_387_length_23294_cov_52.630610_6_plen_412_part_00
MHVRICACVMTAVSVHGARARPVHSCTRRFAAADDRTARARPARPGSAGALRPASFVRSTRMTQRQRLLTVALHVALSLQRVMGVAVATVDPDASARGETNYSSVVQAPPASSSTPRASLDLQGVWNTTCDAALEAACASQRGDAFSCAECVGAHQADLHAHGCDNDFIARWCARMHMWHYENPNDTGACQAGEMNVQIQGVAGKYCAPKCSFLSKCPSDVPPGVTARPTCAIQGMGGTYCALMCNPSGPASQCGRDASCKLANMTSCPGICTYDMMRPTTAADVDVLRFSSSHYEDPTLTGSCQVGEVHGRIQGVNGSLCAPKCSAAGNCPTDVPLGAIGKPTCALQGMGGRYCALLCNLFQSNHLQCGCGARCKPSDPDNRLNSTGICTYGELLGRGSPLSLITNRDAF